MSVEIVNDLDKLKALYIEIKNITENIANERDRLRELISEVEEICDSCDFFLESMDNAMDYISQYI